MFRPTVMLTLSCFVVTCPTWANARPHHRNHTVARRETAPSFVLRVQPISYDLRYDRASSKREFASGPIGPADRIPLRAADHFGRGGVASVGYQPGASRSPVGAHELNTAFSSQEIGFGGSVGGDVSIHF